MAKVADKLGFLFPIQGLKDVARRFPVSVLLSLGFFALAFLSIHKIIDFESGAGIYARLMIWFVCGFFWFGIVDLMTESGRWSGKRKISVSVSVFFILLLLIFFLSGSDFASFIRNLLIALLLGVSLAPYLRSRDDLSYWFFNYRLWFGVSTSIAAGILWALGLCAVLATLQYLFGIKLPIYNDIWVFAATVFTPLYALAWVPRQFSFREEDCHAPPQLSFITNGILIPLLLVYFLILYAYFAKIAFVQEIPRGQLVFMIAGFGIVGASVYMSAWPLRNASPPARFFYRIFFPALILPALVQSYAIFLRIKQYGITEDRYLVVLCACWFLSISLIYTLAQIRKREISMKLIPMILIVLLVLSSFGPWSAPSLSASSQYARLERMLAAHNILQAGKIVATSGDVPFADRQAISGSVKYLVRNKKTERLEQWFGGALPTGIEGQKATAADVVGKMGISFVNAHVKEGDAQSLYFSAGDNDNVLDVRAYDFILFSNTHVSAKAAEPKEWPADPATGSPAANAKLENNILTVKFGADVFNFDLLPLVEREAREGPKDHDDMVLEAASGGMKARLEIDNIVASRVNDQFETRSLKFRFFVKMP